MFGYNRGLFGRNFLVVLAVFVIGASGAFGYNTLTAKFSLVEGFTTFVKIYGGLASFGAILVALFIITLAIFGFAYVAEHVYTPAEQGRKRWHVGLEVGALVLCAIIGVKWIDFPAASAWVAFWSLLLILGATALVTHRERTITTDTP